MSDPHYRDPRLDPPPLREDDARSQRLGELESSNAMWGWVAGAVVLALVLVFVFTRGEVGGDKTASAPQRPAATAPTTTGSGASSTAQTPRPSPSTTG